MTNDIKTVETREARLREALTGLNRALDAFWNDPERPLLDSECEATSLAVANAQERSRAALADPVVASYPLNIGRMIDLVIAAKLAPAVAQARAEAFKEAEAIARKRAEPNADCEHGHVEWDTNAFVCTHRGDCLCIERQEEAEAIADAIAARAQQT